MSNFKSLLIPIFTVYATLLSACDTKNQTPKELNKQKEIPFIYYHKLNNMQIDSIFIENENEILKILNADTVKYDPKIKNNKLKWL